ncbi:hypothetical protein [Streptomyces rubiginosohelvolus]|uniref:Uncharacterized protein n=1 Tax=Streptomyces rubiginosohelvolus TaxID=67362 RepID=A0ABQ3CBN0_9ACTN|nr:hypothetical protein [Streptomyces pluricolorescens]GGZ84185.1 hypothetical protein GCM10010328_67760 [Streptomyces pluricolorescens]
MSSAASPDRETKPTEQLTMTNEELAIELLTTNQHMTHGKADAHRLLRKLRQDWRAEDTDMRAAIRSPRSASNETAILALSTAGAFCGECGFEPGDRGCPDCERTWAGYVKALRAAGWAPASEVLAQAITAVEDREQRRAASGRDALGWESARDVLTRLLRKAAATT